MQKSAAAFRTISEVGEALEVPAHVLRFWESKFNQIRPVKRGGGRRYYRPEDVGLIRGIQHLLYEQGMTIKGAQKVLSDRGVKSVVKLGTDLLSDGQIAEKPVAVARVEPIAETPAPIDTGRSATDTADIRAALETLHNMRRRVRKQYRSIT